MGVSREGAKRHQGGWRRALGLGIAVLLALLPLMSLAAEEDAEYKEKFAGQMRLWTASEETKALYWRLFEESYQDGRTDMETLLSGLMALSPEEWTLATKPLDYQFKGLIRKLGDWNDFLLLAHERLEEVQAKEGLAKLIAPGVERMYAMEAAWTMDALHLYYGEIGDYYEDNGEFSGLSAFEPASPQPGLFLMAMTGNYMAYDAELAEAIVAASGGKMTRTGDPAQANAMVVIDVHTEKTGTYKTERQDIEASSTTVICTGIAFTPKSHVSSFFYETNDPPSNITVQANVLYYSAPTPNLAESPSVPGFVERLMEEMARLRE